jgi:hypothetical protein
LTGIVIQVVKGHIIWFAGIGLIFDKRIHGRYRVATSITETEWLATLLSREQIEAVAILSAHTEVE